MRIVVCAVLAHLLLLAGMSSVSAQVQGQWTATGFMNSPRDANVQLRLSKGGVLSVGGLDSTYTVLGSAEIYSPATGAWQLTGSLQTARQSFAAVLLPSGKVLVVGGADASNTMLGAAELYDPATGLWTPAGTLAVPRYGHTATVLSNGNVLVTGGCTVSGCGTLTAVSELYNPTTNSWSTTGSLATARASHSAVRLKSGKVMVIDGFATGVIASCEIYNPTTGKWSAAASTNAARELHGTTLLPDGKVLVTGGVVSKYPMNSAELYDPAANLWTPTKTMVTGRYAHTSTLLPDGTVLLAGGEGQSISCGKDCTGYIPTASAEIFNEAAGAFTATTALNRALAYHSTTLLSTGRALTAGGQGFNAYCCQVVSDAEYYTPLTVTFSASALNFGALQVGLTSPPQTITINNLSTHASTFKSISATGDYVQTNTCPVTLAAGQSCAVMVTFGPTAAGARTGAVVLKDNAPGRPSQTIALSGTGETTTLGLVPGALDYGSVTVGSYGLLSATLVNDGAAPVALTAITIAPATKTYTQTNTCPATLNVQQTCTISVTFAPPDVFTYSATLSVTGGAGGDAAVQLTGTGVDGG